MKPRLLAISVISALVVLVSTVFTYQVFSYSQEPVEVDVTNPSITLVLPDQDYVISQRDLDSAGKELVIPTLDNVTPKITYNPQLGILESVTSPQDYVIDVEVLRSQLSAIKDDHNLAPVYVLRDRYTTNLADFNYQLNLSYRNPLNISLKDGGEFTDLTLEPELLRRIIQPTSTDLVHPLDVDKDTLISYLTARLTPKQKVYFNPQIAYQNTKNALNSRFMGKNTPVVLGVDDGPSSRGELANKYLEVDLSQQKMYFFIGGSLFKEYKVSTGAEYPTPVGEYHILNKAPNAFSSIYNVWMPYWMGFKYAADVGAYLGLHEIAYAVDAKGKPVYRYGNYIGDMMTGGCVAMEPKDSREIYNLSEVGMLIRIVK
jgi:hypothetical protein